jgi:hypothetical protein
MKKETFNPLSDNMKCIDEIILLQYAIDDGIDADDKKRVESHLGHCNACLLRVQESVFIQSRLHEGPDEEVPPELIAQVNRKWEKKEVSTPGGVKSVPRLILQLAAEGIKILQESFLPKDTDVEWKSFAGPAYAFRSSGEKNPEGQELLLTQKVADKDISAALSIRKDGQESVRICILLKTSSLPLPGKRISLQQDGTTVRSKKTDAEGMLVFPEILPGNYMIRIPSDDIEWALDIMI